MRYAITEKEQKAEVEYSKQRGHCPTCNSLVIGHKGDFKIKHWKHYKRPDCDDWHEPVSEWHSFWQNQFPEHCREVLVSNGVIKHRADIKLDNEIVIEIQNSPIKSAEIAKREKFYGTNKMLWIINGETLAVNSKLNSKKIKKQLEFHIGIPNYLEKVEYYEMDEFRELILETELLKNIILECKNFQISNGNYYVFKFDNDFNPTTLKVNVDNLLEREFQKKYGNTALKYFKINYYTSYIYNKESYYLNTLIKKNWRKFIDLMSYPVFIDNLNGVKPEKLYWLQKNKLIDKEEFLEKYKGYCLSKNG